MKNPTLEDADRLLNLADQFLDDWSYQIDSVSADIDYQERKKEWESIRPLLAAAPALLSALRRMHALAVMCAPITAFGDGSPFDESNKAQALADGRINP